MKYEMMTDYLVYTHEIIGFKCNTPTACNIMPFPANPFPEGLTMKITKIRLFYHARYAVTRYIRGLTSNAMIIIVLEIIKTINIVNNL